MDMREIIKVLIFVLVLVIMIAGGVVLLSGKGFDALSSIKDILRFGR